MIIRRTKATSALLVAVSVLAFFVGPVACAFLNTTGPTKSGELPATLPALRDAIESERARLKDFVSQPAEGSARAPLTPDDLVAIADRLTRLQASLKTLEAKEIATSEPASP
jgi:hypothetical protein